MGFFPMVESFFFLSLGISFFLIFLMVYHFKNRVNTLEKNNEALADICQMMVAELEVLKRSIHNPPVNHFEGNHILSSLFQNMPITEEKVPFIIKEGPAPTFEFEDETEDEIEDKLDIVQDNIVVEEVKNEQELQSIFDDTISELEPTDTETKIKRKAYKKMNLAMLRTIAVNKGFSGSEQELWKLKKADILSWIENKDKVDQIILEE
jgi:hypothetical protein